ncbi:CbtB-domain containing protein [Oleomonas cavernae]|uniref:CbtB-domain containing protein n=1 Tax=Oleomonas cavernae TaxID=2320859 RepID=A0A418WTA6_9PROT|nr:CbtB domain-containing protein [Oleomonas cavernae]RJF94399.1 CbtB-domain containing protein [Oleomonas cavernae]
MTTKAASLPQTVAVPRSRLAVAASLFAMGVGFVFLVGFSHPQSLHDAAHDTRHGLSFPCH